MTNSSAFLAPFAIAITLAGCNSQPEDAPDITEAIPLEDPVPADEDNLPEETGDVEGDIPSVDSPSAPATMESGSNESSEPVSLEGSKLQRADPEY